MLDMAPTPLAHDQSRAVPSLLVIELTGATSALVDGVPVRLAPHRARSGLVPTIARSLLREGRDPASIVRVTRGAARVFQDASLAAWAAIAVREDERTSARFVPFRPFTGPEQATRGDASSRRAVEPQDGR